MAHTHYLELEQVPVTFDPIDYVESAFFDQSNFQMFCVQHGYTDVKVKGLSHEDNFKITIPARGPVSTIKFSGGAPRILSVQRRKVSVEFINIFAESSVEKSLPLKAGSADIIGFYWIFKNEYVLLITTSGVELYSCNPYRMSFKQIKNYALSVSWAIFSPEELILLICIKGTNTIHPFMFKQGVQTAILRLPKFEIDMPGSSSPSASINIRESKAVTVMERDVVIMSLYKQHFVGVIRNSPSPGHSAEVLLYHLTTEAPAKLAHILSVDVGGRFTLSIVDDIVIVHHQAMKTSMQFDIQAVPSSPTVTRHQPMLAPLAVAPTKLQVRQKGSKICALSPSGSPGSVGSSPGASPSMYIPHTITPELYSPKWVFFQPNIIIDAQYGVIWKLAINLEAISNMMPDKGDLIEFLLKRENGKNVIVNVCRDSLEPGRQLSLSVLGGMFDRINSAYSLLQDTSDSEKKYKVSISQRDLYKKVFVRFSDRKDMSYKFLVAVLVEYVRSLNKCLINVEHFIYEMIINVLIENKCFYQLHQFLQYHIISDSKPLAFLLLSRQLVYPPATQLAMDMFKRLSTADSEIIDILLSRGQLLTALRYVKATSKVDAVSARQFLEAAANEDDKMLFYTVYRFFEERNIRLRGNKKFPPDEQCQPFEALYEKWFAVRKN